MGIQLIISFLLVGLLGSLATPLPTSEFEKPKIVDTGLQVVTKVPKEQVEIARNFIEDLISAGKQRSLAYAEPGNADEYVDKLIVNLQKYLTENYEPLSIKDMGEVHWLKVWGLSTIARTGKATLTHEGAGLMLDINLGFKKLHADAYFERQLWWVFWITGTIKADLTDIKIYGKLRVSLKDGVKPKLEDLQVTDWGNVHATIVDGNWIGTIASWFPSLITNFLKNNLPGMIKSAIDNILANVDFQFPIGR